VISPNYINGTWKKTRERLVPDFKEFVKDEEVSKTNKAMFGMANTFKLDVNGDETELSEVVPEQLTDEEVLEF
jgi:hypothetical protein